MTTHQPIETEYAGCRFRSRLEARWAVFFDQLNIRWDYEPEGVQHGEHRYLPDFWLPDIGTWVEVKGSTETLTVAYLTMLAELIDNAGPLARGLLLLGGVPDTTDATLIVHQQLHYVPPGGAAPGGVTLRHVCFQPTAKNSAGHDMNLPIIPISFPGDWTQTSAPDLPRDTSWDATVVKIAANQSGRAYWWPLPPTVRVAYHAARTARFEHGETPAGPEIPKADLRALVDRIRPTEEP